MRMLSVEGLQATTAADHRAHGAEDVHYLILHRKSILWTFGLRHKPNNVLIHTNENKVSPAAQYGLKDSGSPVILPRPVYPVASDVLANQSSEDKGAELREEKPWLSSYSGRKSSPRKMPNRPFLCLMDRVGSCAHC